MPVDLALIVPGLYAALPTIDQLGRKVIHFNVPVFRRQARFSTYENGQSRRSTVSDGAVTLVLAVGLRWFGRLQGGFLALSAGLAFDDEFVGH
jgi:hypothetical protein